MSIQFKQGKPNKRIENQLLHGRGREKKGVFVTYLLCNLNIFVNQQRSEIRIRPPPHKGQLRIAYTMAFEFKSEPQSQRS